MMANQIEEKQGKLKEIGKILKSQYRGIDTVIDKIMDQIETWYIFDKLLYKPTIICLWSLTSHGKTSLIRDLVKLLNMYEDYIEIDLSKTDDSGRFGFYKGPISSKVYSVIKDTDDKAVVLIDEIQKIKTSPSYNEIWSLLSDGKLGSGHFAINKIDAVINALTAVINEYTDSAFESEVLRMASGTPADNNNGYNNRQYGWNPNTQPIPLARKYLIEAFAEAISIQDFNDLSPLFDFHDFSQVKTTFPFGFRNTMLRAINSNAITIKNILDIPGFVYVKPLMEIAKRHRKNLIDKYSQVSSRDPLVLSKLLIFITGNVDGLYTDCKNTNISPDELYAKTLKLTVDDLKNELLKVFLPEEVSRFGGSHIIYPSFPSKIYREIIEDKLTQIEADVKEMTGITLTLKTEKYIKYLESVSVVASQGVRPQISKIYSEVNSIIPKLIKKAELENLKSISIASLKNKYD